MSPAASLPPVLLPVLVEVENLVGVALRHQADRPRHFPISLDLAAEVRL
jgi:hypothetical protein